jgi:predicted enzyme related to lactoylglutathione lyase
MSKRFSNMTRWSQDLNNLLPFYRDTLGLKVAMQGERFVVFGENEEGPNFCLGSHSEIKGSTTDPYRHMVGFEMDDLDSDYRRLMSAGVEFIEHPTDYDGMRIATLKDPEGNLVQLFQRSR